MSASLGSAPSEVARFAAEPDGLLGAGLVAGAAVLVVLVVLLLPILRRRAGDKDPDEGLSVSTAAITLPTTQPEPETKATAAKKRPAAAKPLATEKPTTPPEEPTTP